jgi:hypothetical protein
LDKKHRYIDVLAKRCELKDSLTDVVFKEGQWIEAKIDEDGKVELKKELHLRKAVVTHYESHSEFYVRPAEDDPKYDYFVVNSYKILILPTAFVCHKSHLNFQFYLNI